MSSSVGDHIWDEIEMGPRWGKALGFKKNHTSLGVEDFTLASLRFCQQLLSFWLILSSNFCFASSSFCILFWVVPKLLACFWADLQASSAKLERSFRLILDSGVSCIVKFDFVACTCSAWTPFKPRCQNMFDGLHCTVPCRSKAKCCSIALNLDEEIAEFHSISDRSFWNLLTCIWHCGNYWFGYLIPSLSDVPFCLACRTEALRIEHKTRKVAIFQTEMSKIVKCKWFSLQRNEYHLVARSGLIYNNITWLREAQSVRAERCALESFDAEFCSAS